ncbi:MULTISPECIES: FimV/HubP family polar landmark protein [Methylotenera]|uniref:FimV/HubP family polar landmark protein n=1 Tax=Methylotenera TaxID=359407 RepID=UPI0003A460CA|nr:MULTISPECIES: FimV/HubP family polar landmark protein [Methylotenera]
MALIPISVFAAGLGKLNVNSGLGEPLRAEIELLSVTPDELNSIVANIASEEAYANQGIERPASHKTIKIEIVKNASGTSTLKLKSSQPISEPFLDMLIQVDWASGRLLREYTVLLDPPGYIGEAAADSYSPATSGQTTQAPVIRSTNSAATGTATQSRNSNRNNRAKPVANVKSEASNESSGQEYVTQRGDSLAKIARDMKPEGISLDQMLIGLYQANPNAFDGKNINRLKVGRIIRQPSEQELASVSRQQASKEVKVQSANWNAYRNKLAGIVAESEPGDSEASTQSADGKIKSAAEDKSLPAQAGPKDVVKLSAGEATLTKKEAEDVKFLQAKITALQEESTAREKSVKEAQDKTAALEKQIDDMQKLLALKNGAMSEIQKQAELQAAQDKSNAEQANPVVAETPAPVEAVPAESVNDKPVKVEPPVVTTEANKPVVKVNPAPVVALEPIAEPSILDELDLPLVGSVAGLLILLGGGWLFLRNKRKRNLADFEQGIMTSGGLKANTVFGNTSGSSVDTGDTSFLTDFSQSANGGMIDTNDVDPIAEAEVYMAYGRDAQAEEILKDAISKEPKRYELHLKLLEMYAANKNVSAFETIAGELYTTLGAEDPTWEKVSEIGQKLEPSNPLYQVNTAHSNVSERASSEKLDANDFSDSPIASETDLDFSFDNEALLKDSATSKDAFDFDLDSLNLNSESPSKQENLRSANLDDTDTLNVASDLDAIRSDDLAFNTLSDANESKLDIPTISESEAERISKLVKTDEVLDFDFGQLSSKLETTAETKLADSDSAFGHTMPGLDMSSFNTPKDELDAASDLDEINANKNTSEIEFVNIKDASESIEFPKIDEPDLHALNVDKIDLLDENVAAETDFNFDLSTLSPEAASYVDDEEATVNTFDLSTINLEMEDAVTDSAAAYSSVDEPIEIETKLDLVAAYLDMDDKEGAKELLDEVLKEGSLNQRKRAEALLAKIA